jgi:hypothetical protein
MVDFPAPGGPVIPMSRARGCPRVQLVQQRLEPLPLVLHDGDRPRQRRPLPRPEPLQELPLRPAQAAHHGRRLVPSTP